MTTNLLPCPFCGSHAQTDFIEEHHSYIIECYKCEARTGICVTADDAIAAWNRRSLPDAPPDTSQEWARLDGAVAWHLIDRHGDTWAETGNMMEAWGKARFSSPKAPEGWVFMRHPSRNNGQWIAAFTYADDDGVKWYKPWEESGCDYEWDQRSDGWEVLSFVPSDGAKND